MAERKVAATLIADFGIDDETKREVKMRSQIKTHKQTKYKEILRTEYSSSLRLL